ACAPKIAPLTLLVLLKITVPTKIRISITRVADRSGWICLSGTPRPVWVPKLYAIGVSVAVAIALSEPRPNHIAAFGKLEGVESKIRESTRWCMADIAAELGPMWEL